MVEYKTSKITGFIITKLSDAHNNKIVRNTSYTPQIIEMVLYYNKQSVTFGGYSEKCDYLSHGKS